MAKKKEEETPFAEWSYPRKALVGAVSLTGGFLLAVVGVWLYGRVGPFEFYTPQQHGPCLLCGKK